MRDNKLLLVLLTLFICISCATTEYKSSVSDTVVSDTVTLNNNLVRAVKSGNIDKVRTLVEAGADVDAKVGSGFTALDFSGDTVLMLASQEGNPDIAYLLIEKGADINALNSDGITALMYASQGGHPEVVKLLIEAGADIFASNDIGDTSLMFAAQEGHPEVVMLLIRAGVDVNAQDNGGATALIVASIAGHTDVARLLVEVGADINVQDKEGFTALLAAARFGHNEIIQLMREAGAKEYGEERASQLPTTTIDDQQKVGKSDLTDAMIIAVLDFSIENIPQNEGKVIVDMIGSEIFHTRKFRVIDRKQRETILEEIEFSYADCTDISCQLEFGKLLTANYIVVGSLAQIASRYLISTKLIDVETGETISSAHDVYQTLDDLIDSIGDVVETLSSF